MVRKPTRDPREYKHITLSNQLQAILISEPENEGQAACSLTVGVGSLSDPQDLQGLAHFLEHMCFLGTEKYPEEKSFSQFISQHGGFCNAETKWGSTSYLFEVDPEELEEALDRFAQFFISPLIKEESSSREIQAIEAEFNEVIQNDAARRESLFGFSLNSQHKISSFSWGNIRSLAQKPNLHQETLNFHSQFYSANIMTLCVYSPGIDMETLESWVSSKFSEIPNKNISPLYTDLGIPSVENNNKYFCIVPVKDIKTMDITWMVPPFWSYYTSRPDCYLESLLGHESKGSILYFLKQNGLATALRVGPFMEHTRSWFSLGIQVKLTKKGFENIWTVINAIFTYIDMLKSSKIPCMYFYNELKQMQELEFEYFERMEPIDYCSKISEALQHFPADRVLTAGIYDLIEELSSDAINHMLEYINFERARIDITSNAYENEANIVETWFGTKYCIKDLQEIPNSPEIAEKLYFPATNEFIPTNFDLVKIEEPKPVKVYNTDMVEAWYNTDISYRDSRANAFIALFIPNFRSTAIRSVTVDVIAEVLQNDINDEFGYQAIYAGFNISIEALDNCFEIKVNGFADKLEALIEKIMEYIYTSYPNENSIRLIIERLIQKYKNANFDPKNHSRNSRLVFLQHQQYLEEHKLEIIQQLASAELTCNLAHVKVLIYMTGNIPKSDVSDLSEFTEGLLFAAEGKRVKNLSPRTVMLLRDEILEWKLNAIDPANNCSVIEIYYQFGTAAVEERALTSLLEQILDEDAFDELRTNQQLGYYVAVSSRMTRGMSGLLIKLCSAEYNPDYLMEKINEFLRESQENLKENFREHKKAVISKKKEPFHSLNEKSEHFWQEILQRNFEFERREKEIEYLKKLKIEEFRSWLSTNKFIDRAFVVKVYASKWGEVRDEFSEPLKNDPDLFRSQYPCYSWLPIN